MEGTVEKIRAAIVKCEAGNLFTDASVELEKACKEFLMDRGYKITTPFNYTYKKIKKPDDLIELFYALHRKNHPSDLNPYRSKLVIDRKIAKRFLESRMEVSSLSKKYALRECAEIINALFEFEKEFRFETPLNFGIFGQAKLGWVTEKAIYLLNSRKRLRKKREDAAIQVKLEEMYDSEDDLAIGYANLDKILEEAGVYGTKEKKY